MQRAVACYITQQKTLHGRNFVFSMRRYLHSTKLEMLTATAALLHVFLSTLTTLSAHAQCTPSIASLPTSRLSGHVFRVIRDISPFDCQRECDSDMRCQSFNYRYDSQDCELSNRTRRAWPGHLVHDKGAYYMDRQDPVPLGSVPELPAKNCREMKRSVTNVSASGNYWIDPTNSGKPLKLVCDMINEGVPALSASKYITVVDECAMGIVNCTNQNASCVYEKGSFVCKCKPGFLGDGIQNCSLVRNCRDVMEITGTSSKSGVYAVNPDGGKPIQVYCDHRSSEESWLVLMMRKDGSVDFSRTWIDYKTGFGNLTGEFWLGLDSMNRLTNQTNNRLRFELEDWEGKMAWAEYSRFAIADESDKYRLTSVGKYTGTAGNDFQDHLGFPFTTKDQDNDMATWGNCAVGLVGGWWYNKCYSCKLTGIYYRGGNHNHSYATGINWYAWKKSFYYSARRAEMKMRPE